MKLSDIPAPLTMPFGAQAGAGYIRSIPLASSDQNAASFTLGFPPNTFLSTLLGGKPPDGRDVNGILHYITALLRGVCAGEVPTWSADFSAAVGGYPLNAQVVLSGVLYLSLTDDNTATPGQDAARWRNITDGLLSAATAEATYQPKGDYATNPALAAEVARAERAEAGLLPLAGGTLTGTVNRQGGGVLPEILGATGRTVIQNFIARVEYGTPRGTITFPTPFAEGTVPFVMCAPVTEAGTEKTSVTDIKQNADGTLQITNTGFNYYRTTGTWDSLDSYTVPVLAIGTLR